jgi:hypothetical protein
LFLNSSSVLLKTVNIPICTAFSALNTSPNPAQYWTKQFFRDPHGDPQLSGQRGISADITKFVRKVRIMEYIRGFMRFSNPKYLFLVIFLLVLSAMNAHGASPAGYSEYYIPADEESLLTVLEEIGDGSQGNLMHSVITVTSWSDDTIVYYDHWENGYNFDPMNPSATADEEYTIANRGDSLDFESSNIPANPRGTATYYDGRDRIYVAGGTATVSRAGWTEDDDTLLSVAWEVYPVRPSADHIHSAFWRRPGSGPRAGHAGL